MMSEAILAMEDITKRFVGTLALDSVNFECAKGEVHALVGENGAGKSTLMKIISGAYTQDSGVIYFGGQLVDTTTPKSRLQLGIGIIMQEFNLLPYLTVEENIFLGREPTNKYGLIDSKDITLKTKELFTLLQVEIDPKELVDNLTVAQRQFVEIAKALSLGADLLIMDEPSATLTGHELEYLFKVINGIKEKGTSIIYISHRLEEIFEIADRVTVLKDGQNMGTYMVSDINRNQLVELMVGRKLSETFPPKAKSLGDCMIDVEKITSKKLPHPISFSIHCGEIVGLAGLVGAGRTELARAIFGSDRTEAGVINIESEQVRITSPSDAVNHGVILIPEDRGLEGLVLIHSLQNNVAFPNLDIFSKYGIVKSKSVTQESLGIIQRLNIQTSGVNQIMKNLSGGNQQKVVLGKWLVRNPKVIILDEPTRGIDVGSKAEIYALMRELANKGLAILMISSELPEIIGMSDRILVLHEKQLVAEFDGSDITEQEIMNAATGGN
jgi:ABC-type sugar transport system ATPase subunit